MSSSGTLTETACERAKPDPSGRRDLYIRDDGKGSVVGLSLRVRPSSKEPSGRKTFELRVRIDGRLRRIPLGTFVANTGSLARARRRARDLRVQIDNGRNPADERVAKREAKRLVDDSPTWGELAKRWLKSCETGVGRKRIKRSWKEDERRLNLYFDEWTDTKLVAVADAARVRKRLAEIAQDHGPCEHNQARALLRVMFRTARDRWDLLPPTTPDPTRGIEQYDVAPRDRKFSDSEIARLIEAIDSTGDVRWRCFFTVALALGTRRGELLALTWTRVHDLDGEHPTIELAASTTKTATTRHLPLPRRAVSALRALAADRQHGRRSADGGGWVFPGATGHLKEPKRPWRSICEAALIENARIHDLRHLAASMLVSAGESEALTAAILGHASVQTTRRVYARVASAPQREALDRLNRHVETLRAAHAAKVKAIAPVLAGTATKANRRAAGS